MQSTLCSASYPTSSYQQTTQAHANKDLAVNLTYLKRTESANSIMTEPTPQPSNILTTETVPQYLAERADKIGVFAADAPLTAKVIAGGNVNYAFVVTHQETKQTLFVKQAPEYVAIFGPDGLPLTSQRMQREYNVYQDWIRVLGSELADRYLPKLYYLDDINMVFVMEFLDGYTLLDHDLVEKGVVPTAIARGLADFMARVHAATHSTKVSSEKVTEFTKEYENRAMRDIQLEFVFTKCYKEATDEQRAGLTVDDAFLAEIESLKAAYDGKKTENLCLTHGDLHPGSVMVNDDGAVKVIDPEFTVYGPPALDVGSLLSGYVLAAVHQAYADNPKAVQAIRDAAHALWEAYKDGLQKAEMSDEMIRDTEVDTVGFTVAEVCRTALGFAGGRLWLQFEDADVKRAAMKAALDIVGKCMIGRHEGGINRLWTSLDELVANKVGLDPSS